MRRKPPAKKPRQRSARPIIAILGNVGLGTGSPNEAIGLAKRLRGARCVGIDRSMPPEASAKPGKRTGYGKNRARPIWRAKKLPNWEQRRANFNTGLEGFRDGSVSYITSKLSLGHYSEGGKHVLPALRIDTLEDIIGNKKLIAMVKGSTTKVLNVAYRKLRKGGRVKLVVAEPALEILQESVKRTPFAQEKVSVARIPSAHYVGTYWMKKSTLPLYRVVLEK